MLIKFGLQYCVHIFINRNHLVNYIYQIFIDSNRILLVSIQLGWVTFSFIVYILTDYQIKNVCHKKPLYIMQYSFHIEVLLSEVGLFDIRYTIKSI